MCETETKELIDFLLPYVSERRFELFRKVLDDRTRYMTVVLEDIYQPHNASAVIRTCDCFGVQDLHVIENKYEYELNPDVVVGSSQWVNLEKHNLEINNTLQTISELRQRGYRIVATTPHTNDVELQNFDVEKGKFALFFGSEKPGLSKLMLDNADEFLKIPMYGFTESFNISVSASIILHHLRQKLENSNVDFKITQPEKDKLMVDWLKKTIKTPKLYLKRFYNSPKKTSKKLSK